MLVKFISNITGVMFEGKHYPFENGSLETSNPKLINKLKENGFQFEVLEQDEEPVPVISNQIKIEEVKEEPKKNKIKERDLLFMTKAELVKLGKDNGLDLDEKDLKQVIVKALKGADLVE